MGEVDEQLCPRPLTCFQTLDNKGCTAFTIIIMGQCSLLVVMLLVSTEDTSVKSQESPMTVQLVLYTDNFLRNAFRNIFFIDIFDIVSGKVLITGM